MASQKTCWGKFMCFGRYEIDRRPIFKVPLRERVRRWLRRKLFGMFR